MNNLISISFIGRLLARFVFAAISVLPVALGWLFAPLHFQDGAPPLISIFDAEVYPVAIQLKNFSEDYLSASNEGWLQKTPLGEIKINATALRVLGSDAVIGITNPPDLEMVAAIRLDNLSWSVVQLAHNQTEKLLREGLEEFLETDDFVIAFAGRHLVLGSNPELVGDIVARLGGDSPDLSATPESSPEKLSNNELLTIQSRGILGRFRLSGAWRRKLELDDDGDPELISCALTRVGEEFHLRLRSFQGLDPNQKPDEIFPIEMLNTFLEQAPLPLKKGEVLAIEAAVNPQDLQQFVVSRATVEDPIQQAEQDIIKKAILPYTDGRFSFRLMESPAIEEVLPVPELRGAIGATDAVAMSNALEDYIGKLIDLFRKPGGNELWEAVRRDTSLYQLNSEYPGARIHLHPLFFHKIEPYWFYQPGVDKLASTDKIEWGTHFSKKYFLEPTAIQAHKNNLALTNLQASWRLPPEEIERWKELFFDKAEKHQWLPQAMLAGAHKSAEWTEKTCKIFPSGWLALSILSNKSKGNNDKDSAFYLDIHAVFRIRVGD